MSLSCSHRVRRRTRVPILFSFGAVLMTALAMAGTVCAADELVIVAPPVTAQGLRGEVNLRAIAPACRTDRDCASAFSIPPCVSLPKIHVRRGIAFRISLLEKALVVV